MNFVWLVSLVCLSSVVVRSQDDFQITKRTKTRFCGNHLANTLQLLCHGSYNRYWKKDTPYASIGEREPPSEDYGYEQLGEEAAPRWPFLSRQSANALISRNDFHQRYRRDIVKECCHKPCSINELQGYCAVVPV